MGTRARIATICMGGWSHPTVQGNRGHVLELLDLALRPRPDLVCLPETFGTVSVPHESAAELAETVPGPTTDAVARRAREHGRLVICPLLTQREGRTWNTAVVIDRSGAIVGLYDKVLGDGLSAGEEPRGIRTHASAGGASMPQPIVRGLSILATSLFVLAGCASPRATIVPPSRTPAPPRATARPSSTPAPSRTPRPSATRRPSATPEPEAPIRFELVGQYSGVACAVAVQRGLAYLSLGQRLAVVDITDPVSPTILGETGLLPGRAGKLAVQGRYVYLAAGQRLLTVDAADPRHPHLVGPGVDLPEPALAMLIVGDRLCLSTCCRFLLFSLANGMSPRLIGTLEGGGRGLAQKGNLVYLVQEYTYDSLRVIDIAGPGVPVDVGRMDSLDAFDVAVADRYAYVASYDSGLHVLDISAPTLPQEVGRYGEPDMHTDLVAVSGTRAYVVSAIFPPDRPGSRLQVASLADPTRPRRLGSVDLPGSASSLVVADGYAYCVTLGAVTVDGGLYVVDVRDPANPQVVAGIGQPGSPERVAVAAGHAFLLGGSSLRTLDLSDPAHPREVGAAVDVPWVCFQAVADGRALVAMGAEGLLAVDLRDPARPREAGRLQGAAGAFDVAIAGDYAYVVDGEALQVIDVRDLARLRQVGSLPLGTRMRVVAAGDYAYLLGGVIEEDAPRLALWAVDIRHPAAPRVAGRMLMPGAPAGSSYSLAVAGRYAYFVSEDRGRASTLHVIDVADPANPREVSSLPHRRVLFGLALAGSYLYAGADKGIIVVDVSEPAAPRFVARYSTPEFVADVQVAGDYVYLASRDAGLLVLRVHRAGP